MSTDIKTIKGIKERGINDIEKSKVNTEMSLTRFFGGKNKGQMLQLTMNNYEGYIQLTQKQVEKLIKVLENAFDSEIYPSE
jgi:hypothetical protein